MKNLLGLLCMFLSLGLMADETIQCHGNEPFWGLKVTQNEMNFKREGQNLDATLGPAKNAFGMQEVFLRKRPIMNDNSQIGDLTLIQVSCSDGMSDIDYAYQVVFDHWESDKVYYGCCKEPN